MTTPDTVTLMVTHARPRLAAASVLALLRDPAVDAGRFVVVENGKSLDRTTPPWSEVALHVRIPDNGGPAAGYDLGLEVVRTTFNAATTIFVAEDDLGLFDVDDRLVSRKLVALGAAGAADVGAIVSYGRALDRRTGRTIPAPAGFIGGWERPLLAAWGGTLLRAEALDGRSAPIPSWFFGYEDFDFFLDMWSRGWRVTLDDGVTRDMARASQDGARAATFVDRRATDAAEGWREYYRARNFVLFARRWGSPLWAMDHIVRSVRRAQLAQLPVSAAVATARGLGHGAIGRTGRDDRYVRTTNDAESPSAMT